MAQRKVQQEKLFPIKIAKKKPFSIKTLSKSNKSQASTYFWQLLSFEGQFLTTFTTSLQATPRNAHKASRDHCLIVEKSKSTLSSTLRLWLKLARNQFTWLVHFTNRKNLIKPNYQRAVDCVNSQSCHIRFIA